MAKQQDVRRIALALPGVTETEGHFGFAVRAKGKAKGFVWAWRERVDPTALPFGSAARRAQVPASGPKKARVPSSTVIAVRVANELEKQMLLSVDPDKFFTEPHYNGYPAVLVRLTAVTIAELRQVIGAAWRCQAQPEAKPAAKRKPKSRR